MHGAPRSWNDHEHQQEGHLLRRHALALLLAILPACTTFYQATLPPAAGLDAIDHCLLTFALANRSADPEYAPVVAAEPDLVAIWDAFREYARKPRRAIVFVRKRSDGWEIRFVPEKRDASGVIEIYARGFARCMALHEPPVEVDLVELEVYGKPGPSGR